MNITEINSKFVDKIKDRIAGSNIVGALADALPLNKEAIYRRLRGEVPFTYGEAVLISRKLNISLDELNLNPNSSFVFKIDKQQDDSIENAYLKTLQFLAQTIQDQIGLEHLDTSIYSQIIGGVPLPFTLCYESLSKFRYLKWVYENRNLQMQMHKISDICISQDYIDANNKLGHLLRQMNNIFIISNDMVRPTLTTAKHFIALNLIDQADAELIRMDLHKMIDELETIVATGKYPDGGNVTIYTTDVSILSVFGSIENAASNFRNVFVMIFANNFAFSYNVDIYNMYKIAFEDYKDYATMISKSSAAVRKTFIERQHQLIDEYLG